MHTQLRLINLQSRFSQFLLPQHRSQEKIKSRQSFHPTRFFQLIRRGLGGGAGETMVGTQWCSITSPSIDNTEALACNAEPEHASPSVDNCIASIIGHSKTHDTVTIQMNTALSETFLSSIHVGNVHVVSESSCTQSSECTQHNLTQWNAVNELLGSLSLKDITPGSCYESVPRECSRSDNSKDVRAKVTSSSQDVSSQIHSPDPFFYVF